MNNQGPRVLVVEDEREVLRINARMFTRHGYQVLMAENCRQAKEQLEKIIPDLLILDIMLPDGNGYDICETFRRICDHPVIFLTGKDQVSDRIEGLDRGGDYYLTKPYHLDELLAVANRLLERHIKTRDRSEQLVTITRGSLVIDIPNGKAWVRGCDAGLTAKEFALLLLLVKNEDKELSPQMLYEKVWGVPAGGDTRTIRFHITNLRKKIKADEMDDYDIISVYGKGYVFTTLG